MVDDTLTNLRQRASQTAGQFIRAQHAYLEAANLIARKSETTLKRAAEGYQNAIGPYDAALQALRQYLLAAEPSEAMAEELERTERLIDALDKEKKVTSKLVAHHLELITQDVELTSHRDEEEEK